jgi:hypothetical protein
LSADGDKATSPEVRMLHGIGLRFFSVRIVTADNNIYVLAMKQDNDNINKGPSNTTSILY